VMLRCTQAFNVSGHPAITLPCGSTTEGLTTEGLPLGAQIIGVYQDTAGLLQIARAVESVVAARAENYLGPGRSR
jgi:Asp-tRNA(Asn)/Glu-tRNA(Gln) amidotransferase A subunit family amidase